MATGVYPVIVSATSGGVFRRSSDATPLRVRVVQLLSPTAAEALAAEEAEWESAFASPEFALIVARARAHVASGQTKPMRLEDL